MSSEIAVKGVSFFVEFSKYRSYRNFSQVAYKALLQNYVFSRERVFDLDAFSLMKGRNIIIHYYVLFLYAFPEAAVQ